MKRLTTELVAMKLPQFNKVWEFTATHWETQFKNEVKLNGKMDRWTPVDSRVVISKDLLIFELEENENNEQPKEVVLNIKTDGTSTSGELRETKGGTEKQKKTKRK